MDIVGDKSSVKNCNNVSEMDVGQNLNCHKKTPVISKKYLFMGILLLTLTG